jgi:hypothetical protein
MSGNNERSGGGMLSRIGHLGLAAGSAILGLIVVVAVVVFFVGRASGGSSKTVAGPAVTTTVTVTPTAAPTPVGSTPVTPGTSSSPSSAPGGPAVTTGVKLGSYTVKISPGFSVPLGAAAPKQAQFVNGGGPGTDLYFGGSSFVPEGSDKMLSLSNGATPSDASCTADTVFVGQTSSTHGTAFCLTETGAVAGVTVGATSPTGSYIVAHVTVWKSGA